MLSLHRVVLSTVQVCLLFILELKGVKGRSESPRESDICHRSRRPWGISAEPPRKFATQVRHSTLLLTPVSWVLQPQLVAKNTEAAEFKRLCEDISQHPFCWAVL